MMKNNFKEIETMAIQFNNYVNRKLIWISTVLVIVGSFGAGFMVERDWSINFGVSILMGVVFYISLKRMFANSAKKINRTSKIIELETNIEEDKITEKTIFENNVETTSQYFYTDICKIGEDKYNFYLYITSNSAIIVSKQKLENIDAFRNMINQKCANIKK